WIITTKREKILLQHIIEEEYAEHEIQVASWASQHVLFNLTSG
ncbi:2205_t:CDS:1, partial [Acaulospora morrowiae]